MKNFLRIASITTLSISLIFLSECNQDEVKQKCVIVLLDETGSFGIYREDGVTMFWSEVIERTCKIVERLEAGDNLFIIGIDDHGFDTDDVLLSQQLDPRILIASQQKRRMWGRIRELTPRRHRRNLTDILGALYHTAYLLSKQSNQKGIVIVFSDMIQTPKYPTLKEAEELRFPDGTEIYCFYVNASEMDELTGKGGREEWERILNIWIPIFRNSGLNVDESRFFQRAEVQDLTRFESILDKIFGLRRE